MTEMVRNFYRVWSTDSKGKATKLESFSVQANATGIVPTEANRKNIEAALVLSAPDKFDGPTAKYIEAVVDCVGTINTSNSSADWYDAIVDFKAEMPNGTTYTIEQYFLGDMVEEEIGA
jgi:hypothetical protein